MLDESHCATSQLYPFRRSLACAPTGSSLHTRTGRPSRHTEQIKLNSSLSHLSGSQCRSRGTSVVEGNAPLHCCAFPSRLHYCASLNISLPPFIGISNDAQMLVILQGSKYMYLESRWGARGDSQGSEGTGAGERGAERFQPSTRAARAELGEVATVSPLVRRPTDCKMACTTYTS